VPGQLVLDRRLVEPDMPDDRVRQAVLGRHPGQPAGLAELVGPIPFGLDMHGLHDVEALGHPPVVRRHELPFQRRVVAEEELRFGMIGEPGVVIALQVPKMMMSVDDREVGHDGGCCIRMTRQAMSGWHATGRPAKGGTG
jgi:hypothetical protein